MEFVATASTWQALKKIVTSKNLLTLALQAKEDQSLVTVKTQGDSFLFINHFPAHVEKSGAVIVTEPQLYWKLFTQLKDVHVKKNKTTITLKNNTGQYRLSCQSVDDFGYCPSVQDEFLVVDGYKFKTALQRVLKAVDRYDSSRFGNYVGLLFNSRDNVITVLGGTPASLHVTELPVISMPQNVHKIEIGITAVDAALLLSVLADGQKYKISWDEKTFFVFTDDAMEIYALRRVHNGPNFSYLFTSMVERLQETGIAVSFGLPRAEIEALLRRAYLAVDFTEPLATDTVKWHIYQKDGFSYLESEVTSKTSYYNERCVIDPGQHNQEVVACYGIIFLQRAIESSGSYIDVHITNEQVCVLMSQDNDINSFAYVAARVVEQETEQNQENKQCQLERLAT